jgi:hypothetical protein
VSRVILLAHLSSPSSFYTEVGVSTLSSFNDRKLTPTDALQILGVIPCSPSPVRLEDRSIDDLTNAEVRQAYLNLRERLQQTKKEEPDVKPRIAPGSCGDHPDKPIALEDDDSSDDGHIEVVDVVNLAEKRKADMLDISDDDE